MTFGRLTTLVTVLLLALLSSGCGTHVKMTGSASRAEERDFAGALQYLLSGNESAAREFFERTINAPSVAGVTDEALFRLSLLNLREEGGRGELHARILLNRLILEFPASIWAKQAAPLSVYLKETLLLRASRNELKNLRNQNISLSRDNKELRQIIERLKKLDIELEQKIGK